MKNNIIAWNKQVLKKAPRTFFMVNEAWVNENKSFIKQNGIELEYPKVIEEVIEDVIEVEENNEEESEQIETKQTFKRRRK